MKPTFAQLRFLKAVAELATAGPVRLGDALTKAGEPTVQRRTVTACQRYGWLVRHDGQPPTWALTDSGRTEVGVDPSTGRPWGVDEDGFDHNLPHPTVNGCPADSCICGAYHCGWFCQEMHDERSSS